MTALTQTSNEVVEFEKLLDNLDAAYREHNDRFEKLEDEFRQTKYNFEDDLDPLASYPELAEFEKRIEEAHEAVSDAWRAANGKKLQDKLRDLAYERSYARPKKLTRWLDPKAVREAARKHVGRTNHRVWGRLSINEVKKHREAAAECQAKIDAQGGKCIQCGEPIDIFQQMMTDREGHLRCDVCVNEEMIYPHHIIF
jgi:hypothetical protein